MVDPGCGRGRGRGGPWWTGGPRHPAVPVVQVVAVIVIDIVKHIGMPYECHYH